MAVLFLFFFSFTTNDLSAQTDYIDGPTGSLSHNGVRYDLDKILSQYTFVGSDVAASLYKNAALTAENAMTLNQDDDQAYNELSLKRDLYKSISTQLLDGRDVEVVLKFAAFEVSGHIGQYWNSNSNLQQPDVVALFEEAVQIAAQ